MGNFLMISTSVDLVRIAYNRIVYIAADGNYSNIVQANGETVLVTFQWRNCACDISVGTD